MKICTKCKVEKSYTEFHKLASNPDGYHYNCKDCKRAYRKQIDQLPHNIAKSRAYHFKYKYGISVEEYDDLFEAQRGLCAICEQPETRLSRSRNIIPLVVDHDHETGEVRGLLCSDCNIALGLMKDKIERLRNAISYLEGVRDRID